MGLLDLLSDKTNRFNLGTSMLVNNDTDSFWKNTGMGVQGWQQGEMERQLAELERQKLEASMKTKDMRNWEFSKANPGFADFLSTDGSGSSPTAQMKNWKFRQELIKKHGGNENHPEVVQFDNWVRKHDWRDFGTYYGLTNPNVPGSQYMPPMGRPPMPVPPGMENIDIMTPEGQAQAQKWIDMQNGQSPARGSNNPPYSSNLPPVRLKKDVYGKKREEEQAKIDVGKEAKAPSEMANLQFALETIDRAITHPGRESATGASSYFPSRRGGAAYSYETLHDQIKNQTFVRVRELLKGAGAVTDFEGQKAESAFNRLDLGLGDEEYANELKIIREQIVMAQKAIQKYLSQGGSMQDIYAAGSSVASGSQNMSVEDEFNALTEGMWESD